MAAPFEVDLFGVPRCERALPAADFDFEAVDEDFSTLEDFDAAFFPVSFDTVHLAVELAGKVQRACPNAHRKQ